MRLPIASRLSAHRGRACQASSTPRVRMRSTFWMLVTLGVTVTLVCEYSASCVRSKNSVLRSCCVSCVHSALSSAFHDVSGRRSGSPFISMPMELTLPWYSSDTVGMRTARPSEAFRTQSSANSWARAALGDT